MREHIYLLTALLLTLALGAARAEEVSLAFNGLTLIGERRMAEGATMEKGTMVLMTHGTLAHGRMEIMQSFQDLLAEKGISSLAINLSLGQSDRRGMYECGKPHTHRHTDALDEIGAWVEWLERQGVKEIVLLGHSRGGNQTAWYAAERRRPTVGKVVLVAPMTWSREAARAEYRKLYGRDPAPILREAKRLTEAGRGAATLAETDFIYCPGATVSAASFADYYADEPRFDTPSLLPRIGVPTLVVAGSEDTVVGALIPKVRPLAEKGMVKLFVVDGADHFFRDLYADEAVEAIAGFVGE